MHGAMYFHDISVKDIIIFWTSVLHFLNFISIFRFYHFGCNIIPATITATNRNNSHIWQQDNFKSMQEESSSTKAFLIVTHFALQPGYRMMDWSTKRVSSLWNVFLSGNTIACFLWDELIHSTLNSISNSKAKKNVLRCENNLDRFLMEINLYFPEDECPSSAQSVSLLSFFRRTPDTKAS